MGFLFFPVMTMGLRLAGRRSSAIISFFGNLVRYPSFQSSGTSSTSQIFSKRRYNISTVVSISALSASQGIPSGPGALPLFSCLIAILISSLVSMLLCGLCGGDLLSNSSLFLLFLPHNFSACLIFHSSFWIPELSRQLLGGVIQTFHIPCSCCLLSCFSYSIYVFRFICSDALLGALVSIWVLFQCLRPLSSCSAWVDSCLFLLPHPELA